IKMLRDLQKSNKAQFVVVYGRRRVGKTFLIDEALQGCITFRHAGLSPLSDTGKKNLMPEQLLQFYHSLLLQGMKRSHVPSSWLEAFFMLETHLQQIDNGEKQVVFLDELPWMDTPRSGFITALESFWNSWACHRHNMMLVVSGSANSWVQDKLINNHGGLYGRLTYQIKLAPFSLKECERFYKMKQIKISRYDMVQCYMILGGIPYYLDFLESGLSLSQNIDNLLFSSQPKLWDEYSRLFASVFPEPDTIKAIVQLLGTRHSGFTRREIVEHLKIEDNGMFSDKLKALIASDFVERYVPFGDSVRNARYRLIDQFCIFSQHFVNNRKSIDENLWSHGQVSQSITSWRGFAFEEVCLRHIKQIKRALGIEGVASSQSAWTMRGDEDNDGTQIDLIISRKDDVVNLCEMKFLNNDFVVSKEYNRKMIFRENLLEGRLSRKSIIHSTLITTYGLKYNEYSGTFQNVITMDDLFA
ncbi:MAG: AAA family ATPase, partial [archaeon]|nr:AAA family ATPase [archaeon]